MLSNETLSNVVDALSYLGKARVADDRSLAADWLDLAVDAIDRVVTDLPDGHHHRKALLAKQRQVIFARAALLS